MHAFQAALTAHSPEEDHVTTQQATGGELAVPGSDDVLSAGKYSEVVWRGLGGPMALR